MHELIDAPQVGPLSPQVGGSPDVVDVADALEESPDLV